MSTIEEALIQHMEKISEQAKEIKKLKEQNGKLKDACTAAYNWLDRFGQHAPITFGGEAELSKKLSNALS